LLKSKSQLWPVLNHWSCVVKIVCLKANHNAALKDAVAYRLSKIVVESKSQPADLVYPSYELSKIVCWKQITTAWPGHVQSWRCQRSFVESKSQQLIVLQW